VQVQLTSGGNLCNGKRHHGNTGAGRRDYSRREGLITHLETLVRGHEFDAKAKIPIKKEAE
jgi:hypothetical protein